MFHSHIREKLKKAISEPGDVEDVKDVLHHMIIAEMSASRT